MATSFIDLESSTSTTTTTTTIGHSNCHCRLPLSMLTPWSQDFIQSEINDQQCLIQNIDQSTKSSLKVVTFKMNEHLNSKIILWNGCSSSMLRLKVDAIVHPTNERFERNSNPLTNALYKHAGPELRKTLYNKLKYCPIGSIKITKGYSIAANYIIHTASPHYKCKYHTASETALFNCYLHVLQAAKHYNIRILAIGNLALMEHHYPELDGIHLGIRVIRRFMESYPDAFDTIILCMQNEHEYDLYRSVLKLYFSRNQQEEQMQSSLLPTNNGGPMGEPIIPERAIRIQENPIKSLQEINDSGLDDSGDDLGGFSYSSSYSTDANGQGTGSEINIDECRERLIELKYQQEFDHSPSSSTSPMKRSSSYVTSLFHAGNHHSQEHYSSMESMTCPSSPSFARKQHYYHSSTATQSLHNFDDYDQQDQLMLIEHKRQLKFERLLRKIRRQEKELSETIRDKLQECIYISTITTDGGDKDSVLIIIGRELANLYHNELDGHFDQIIVHFVKMLDKICHQGRKFSVVYFHTMVDNIESNVNVNDRPPKTQLISRLYEFISYQHQNLLKSFYVIHPSVFNRLYVWWLKTFHCKFLKNKVQFIQRLQQLQGHINRKHFEQLPSFIMEFENKSKSTIVTNTD
uniref:Ganglioside-induced differentiation-associated-protein 2-like n=1 Tax=Dermatophagoides pteronyssinus TaxID=6956 RepID=A0A6P6XQJ5_DERPT|nr:ganglioside-induced differentiation-associated-protein 2-like [Dermatophagoides pteronyssinus]